MKDLNNFNLKPITAFLTEDTLYMTRKKGGYVYTLLLQFVSFNKGKVTGKILDIQPNNNQSIWFGKEYYKIGSEISTIISKCYTYEIGYGCHWFEKEDNSWVCR
jgi:hypothetical protein